MSKKIEMFEQEILRLRNIIYNLEKKQSEISSVVKNQSELISAIAGIQSDMIGAFVMNSVDIKSDDSSLSKSLKNIIVLPSEDDDMIN